MKKKRKRKRLVNETLVQRRKKMKVVVALTLLAKGYSYAFISTKTGLTYEHVVALADDINLRKDS